MVVTSTSTSGVEVTSSGDKDGAGEEEPTEELYMQGPVVVVMVYQEESPKEFLDLSLKVKDVWQKRLEKV